MGIKANYMGGLCVLIVCCFILSPGRKLDAFGVGVHSCPETSGPIYVLTFLWPLWELYVCPEHSTFWWYFFLCVQVRLIQYHSLNKHLSLPQ